MRLVPKLSGLVPHILLNEIFFCKKLAKSLLSRSDLVFNKFCYHFDYALIIYWIDGCHDLVWPYVFLVRYND